MRELNSLLLILIISHCGYSQSIVSTAGEEFSSSSGRLSWTLGEPVIETVGSNSNILTQGFQQDYLNILNVSEHFNLDDLNIYPNPARNGKISISTKNSLDKNVVIYSILGSVVYNKTIRSNEVINVQNLSTGLYLVQVEEDEKVSVRKLLIN